MSQIPVDSAAVPLTATRRFTPSSADVAVAVLANLHLNVTLTALEEDDVNSVRPLLPTSIPSSLPLPRVIVFVKMM